MTHGALGVGLIGCGNIGIQHIAGWRRHPADSVLVAVADAVPARLDAGRVAAGLTPDGAYPSYQRLLDRDDVDVVDLCVPPYLRREMAEAAARAGKHILSEKPLATVPADAAAIVAAAEMAGVVLGEVHNYLFQPEIATASRLIADGAIGDPEVAIINYLGMQDHPGAAEYSPAWRHDVERSGGGVLIDMLHLAYVAEALLGGHVERVSGYVDARDEAAPVEGLALCRFETTTAAALANVGWGHGPGGIEVSGSRGRISIRYEGGGTFAPFRESLLTDEQGTRVVPVAAATATTIALAIADFASAVVEGRAPIANGVDGLRALEAIIATYASSALDRTVALPLDRDDPVFLRGVAGLRELDLPQGTRIRRKRIFGVGGDSPSSDA
jgi:predicted dehydrogenase